MSNKPCGAAASNHQLSNQTLPVKTRAIHDTAATVAVCGGLLQQTGWVKRHCDPSTLESAVLTQALNTDGGRHKAMAID
jgi:hypothetical protein